MNVLLIVPESQGTIAKVSYNLFSAIKSVPNIQLFVAILDDRQSSESLDFGNNKFVFEKSKYNKINGFFLKCNFIAKLKTELSIDISISTLLGCNIINAITCKKDKSIGIFHAPLAQTKLLGKLTYLWCRFGYKYYVPKLDRVVAVSETVKDDLIKYIDKQVDVVYNIHNFDDILKKSSMPIQSDDECLIEKPYILYVGGLYDTKGPDRLIRAFSKSKLKNEYNLIFIGPDVNNSLQDYKELANMLDIQDSVYFIGYRSNPYPFIKRSQFLISPSRSEGLPGVIIESLFLGTPVVCTNSSKGVYEIMECLDQYDVNLDRNLNTKYGIITPNTKNEALNEECLSNAMQSMSTVNKTKITFNNMRFTKDIVIRQLFDC